jgi:hypothetical protein
MKVILKFNLILDGFPCYGRLTGNGRLDAQHWLAFGITQSVYIALILICFLFRDEFPLNTRSISPFVALTIQYLNNVSYHLMNYLNYENRNYYLCFFESFTVYPMGEISFILPGILLVRYFLITRMKTHKVTQYENDKEGKKSVTLPWRFKILKFLGNSNFLILILILIWVVLQGVYLIFLAIFKFQCSKTLDQVLVVANFTIVSIVSVIYFLFCFIDIVVHIPLLLKCEFRKFINSDRFFFRVELVLSFPIYSSFVIFNFIPHSDVIHFFLSSIMRWGLNIILVFCPLAFSIYFHFTKKFKKINQSDLTKIDLVFANEEYKKCFEKFCKEEYSIENFSFREDVEKFQKITNPKLRREAAEMIYIKYLTDKSWLELNTVEVKKRKLEDKLAENEITKDMFQDILRDANTNLFDTFSRWMSTPEFQLIKQNQLIVSNVLVEDEKVRNTEIL